MKDLELNKVFASLLVGALVLVGVGVIVDILYQPMKVTRRGFEIEVTESLGGKAEAVKLDIPTLLASANIEKGKIISKKCIACHNFGKGEPNKVGPNLWGVVGSKKAHLGGSFKYSKAMLSQSGIWGYDELFHFLKKPQGYIAGTIMAFAGISKPEQVADVVLYMNSMSDNPLALPPVVVKEEREGNIKNNKSSSENGRAKGDKKSKVETKNSVLTGEEISDLKSDKNGEK